MIAESLIVYLCISGSSGCTESTSAYYYQSQELQNIGYNVEKTLKSFADNNKYLVYVGTPVLSLLANRTANVRIYRGTSVGYDPKDRVVSLNWAY